MAEKVQVENKYFAVVRKQGDIRPVSFNLAAMSLREALDDMCYYAGVEDLDSIEEYELLQIIGLNKYVPVSLKIKSNRPSSAILQEKVEAKVMTETLYRSYKDAA